ncbi:hypothetical protein AUJ14_01245 [Candidatus Micrarchaeota archaeon CG1_02_55_22]|nr:MAG: hypothetical protein AUJ14_01245 [Candidatus Micrarchaeota archaeon CG1_02_55_22]
MYLRNFVFLVGLVVISISVFASATVVSNGGFESGATGWTLKNAGTVVVSGAPCDSESCLKLPASTGSYVGSVDQIVSLQPGPYELSFRSKYAASVPYLLSTGAVSFKSLSSYASVVDESWNRACSPKPGRIMAVLYSRGRGEWQRYGDTFFVPAVDDCGEPTATHSFRLLLNYSATSIIPANVDAAVAYVDDVAVTSLTHSGHSLPAQLGGDELESGEWYGYCVPTNTSQPFFDCPQEVLPQPAEHAGLDGILVAGNSTLSEYLRLSVSVKPLTTYLIRVNFSIADRKCVNYLGTGYYKLPNPNGIGCGELSLSVNESGSPPALRPRPPPAVDNITNPAYPMILFNNGFIGDSPIYASDRDWFEEYRYFKTSNETYYLWFDLATRGFDGKFYLSNLSLSEVQTVAPDFAIEVPITTGYADMKIVSFTTAPLSVATGVSRFDFVNNQIRMTRETEAGRLAFPDGFLSGLSRTDSGLQGLVVLENANAKLVVGADSSLIVRLKQPAHVTLSGPPAAYSWFESGVVFQTDWSKGILFTQIKPDNLVLQLPRTYDPAWDEFTYDKPISDLFMQSHGALNWNVEKNFSSNGIPRDWRVGYDFAPGDAFLASVFPSKDYNETAFCKQRTATAANEQVRDYDLSPYYFARFGQTHSILNLWISAYDHSVNNQPLPFVVRNNSASGAPYIAQSSCTLNTTSPLANVSCTEFYQSRYTQYVPTGQSAYSSQGGPYSVDSARLDGLKRSLQAAHSQGVKVIAYTTPGYYYNSDPSAFVFDLKQFSDATGIDGFYFDGYPPGVLRSLELARRFRNVLPNAYLSMHSSQNVAVLPRTDNLRNPLLDAYADDLLVGESTKFGDDTSWRLVFCQRGISNTVTTASIEMRVINYSVSWADNLPTLLDLTEQGGKSLACGGQIRFWPFSTKIIRLSDPSYPGQTLASDWRPYFSAYSDKCLPVTCGDSVCDSYESIYNCPADCAPQLPQSTDVRGLDVGQWLSPAGPLYAMHFSFDGDLVRDDSGNKLQTDERLGSLIPAPEPVVLDDRRAYWFNSTQSVFGPFFENLDFTGRAASVFTTVKFAFINLSDGATLYRFINGSATLSAMTLKKNSTGVYARAFANSSTGRPVYLESLALADGWHSLGTVFDPVTGAITLYADGSPAASTSLPEGLQGGSGVYNGYYTVGADSSTPGAYKGWDGRQIYTYYVPSVKKPFIGFMDDLLLSFTEFTPGMARAYHVDGGKSFGLTDESSSSYGYTDGWQPVYLDDYGKPRALPESWITPLKYTLYFSAGQNMVSVPLTNAHVVSSTCGNLITYLYSPRSNSYQYVADASLPLLNGRGAWVYSSNACSMTFYGSSSAYAPSVSTGWNILDGVAVASVKNCDVYPVVFSYSPVLKDYTRSNATSAVPGTAYWALLSCG